MGIHNPKFKDEGKKMPKGCFSLAAISPASVGPAGPDDPRIPCSLTELPTEEEARAQGFDTVEEYYSYSAGGSLVCPKAVAANFRELQRVQQGAEDLSSNIAQHAGLLLGDAGQVGETELVGAFFPSELEDDGSPIDCTAAVAAELGISHPYLLVDVEPRTCDIVRNLRSELAVACRTAWEADVGPVQGKEDVPIDLRDATGRVSVVDIRGALKESIARDPEFGPIAVQKEVELDPEK